MNRSPLPAHDCLVLYNGWPETPMVWVHAEHCSSCHRCRVSGVTIEPEDVIAWIPVPNLNEPHDTERPPASAPSSVEADMAEGVTLTEALRKRGFYSRTGIGGRVVCSFATGEPVARDEHGGEMTFSARDAWEWLKEQEGGRNQMTHTPGNTWDLDLDGGAILPVSAEGEAVCIDGQEVSDQTVVDLIDALKKALKTARMHRKPIPYAMTEGAR